MVVRVSTTSDVLVLCSVTNDRVVNSPVADKGEPLRLFAREAVFWCAVLREKDMMMEVVWKESEVHSHTHRRHFIHCCVRPKRPMCHKASTHIKHDAVINGVPHIQVGVDELAKVERKRVLGDQSIITRCSRPIGMMVIGHNVACQDVRCGNRERKRTSLSQHTRTLS